MTLHNCTLSKYLAVYLALTMTTLFKRWKQIQLKSLKRKTVSKKTSSNFNHISRKISRLTVIVPWKLTRTCSEFLGCNRSNDSSFNLNWWVDEIKDWDCSKCEYSESLSQLLDDYWITRWKDLQMTIWIKGFWAFGVLVELNASSLS